MMQLLQDHGSQLQANKDLHIHTNMPLNHSSDNMMVKEKRSSCGSLMLMNRVASGDNVATGRNSTHKLKDEVPVLIPCCEGRELQINEELVRSGLSAISIRHESVFQCLSLSRAYERPQGMPGLVKHRNSFRSIHRPDLKRVPYLRRMTPDELETLFKGYADTLSRKNDDNLDENTKLILPPDENIMTRDLKDKEVSNLENGAGIALHAIPETGSGFEDIPAGMRLHGARARLYTSVLAGATAGDQLDGSPTQEDYNHQLQDDSVPEEEVQLSEELQIILPPRCDDVTADSSITTNSSGI